MEVAARFLKTSGSAISFFRRLEGDQTNWVVSSQRYTPAQFGFMVGHTSPTDIAASAERRVKEAIKTSHFGHACSFDCEAFGVSGSRWFYWSMDGQGGCWNGPGSAHNATIFRLEQNSFEREMDNTECEIRFALGWSQLSEDERIKAVIHFQNGDLSELRAVVRALGIAEAARQNVMGNWAVSFADLLRFGADKLWALRNSPGNARLRRWSHHLNRYFALHKDEALAARYLCVASFHLPHYTSFEEGPPSAHERLEAALFLRDWARGKIPPDELQLLLPKL